MNAAQIVSRLDSLKTSRGPVEAKWNDIDRFVLPLTQGNFMARATQENEQNWDTKDVWDSTAPIGAERLASVFFSGLLSGRWFGISFMQPKLNKDPAAKMWADEVGDILFDAIMTSNFPVEMATAFLDFVGYGNCALTQELASEDEETWKGFDFGAIPIREVYFEQDFRGRVYRWFRPISWTATQIVSKFRHPEDPTKPHPSIPEKIVEAAKGARADDQQRYEVVFCIYPRDGAKPMELSEKTRAAKLRPYGYKYVLREGLVELGEEGGFYEMPTYIGRYSRAASSQWGFGPALLALPTTKLVNALQEDVVLAAGKAIDPATLVTERGLLSDLDLGQGGITTVRSTEDIVVLESKARVDIGEALIGDQRMMLRRLFREDDITLKDSPAMTATEVIRRTTLLNQLFAPQTRRCQNDIFAPMIQMSFGAMWRAGQLPSPPEIVLAQKGRLRVDYYGPMMRAQRDDEVVAIERVMAAVGGSLKMGFTGVQDDYNPAGALRKMSELLSTPGEMWNTKEDSQKNREQRQQMEQAMAQAQIEKTSAEGKRAMAGAEEMQRG